MGSEKSGSPRTWSPCGFCNHKPIGICIRMGFPHPGPGFFWSCCCWTHLDLGLKPLGLGSDCTGNPWILVGWVWKWVCVQTYLDRRMGLAGGLCFASRHTHGPGWVSVFWIQTHPWPWLGFWVLYPKKPMALFGVSVPHRISINYICVYDNLLT